MGGLLPRRGNTLLNTKFAAAWSERERTKPAVPGSPLKYGFGDAELM